MNSENELMQKLLISKKIMERHNVIPRNTNGIDSNSFSSPQVQNFDTPNASYNIPQELIQENSIPKVQKSVNSDERILSSKLPDSIKQLMIEHPIHQPDSMSGGAVLSNDLVEKAARLMNNGNSYVQESSNKQTTTKQTQNNPSFDNQNLRSLLKEVVQEVLSENGMITESTQKTNDVFTFRVGKHVFEGKVTKVKKIS